MNAEKTKYMALAHRQNAEQNCDIIIGNVSFEDGSYFRYWVMSVTDQNFIHGELEK
jgi:hypothetical protein